MTVRPERNADDPRHLDAGAIAEAVDEQEQRRTERRGTRIAYSSRPSRRTRSAASAAARPIEQSLVIERRSRGAGRDTEARRRRAHPRDGPEFRPSSVRASSRYATRIARSGSRPLPRAAQRNHAQSGCASRLATASKPAAHAHAEPPTAVRRDRDGDRSDAATTRRPCSQSCSRDVLAKEHLDVPLARCPSRPLRSLSA